MPHGSILLNAVDSFARLNDIVFKRSGQARDGLKRWLYDRYESKMLRTVAGASFVSEADLAYVRERNPQAKLWCIPNGVDTSWFSADDRIRDPASVLFTGNFAYQPNANAALHFARDILPLIRARRPDATFLVAGREPPRELDGIDGVETLGFVPDIRDAYRRATVFACPLRSGAGIKNKVLEAMACEVPIVTTSLGVDGIPGAYPGVHYLQAEDPRAFADRILQLLDEPDRRVELGRLARQLVQGRMNWDAVVNHYFSALAEVAASSADPVISRVHAVAE